MSPRKTADVGALFNALVEDLRIQVAASVDQSLHELQTRINLLERKLALLQPAAATLGRTQHTAASIAGRKTTCTICQRIAVARRLCSAHYQQWRYRQRKSPPQRHERHERHEQHDRHMSPEQQQLRTKSDDIAANTLILNAKNSGMSKDN